MADLKRLVSQRRSIEEKVEQESRGRILLVDDEQPVLDALKTELEDFGYEVDAFTSAPEALKCVGKKPYDMAVFDILMPVMSGIELLRKVREVVPWLPVAFFSAYKGLENTDQDVKGVRPEAYLQKLSHLNDGVDTQQAQRELYATIETLVETGRLRRETRRLQSSPAASASKDIRGAFEELHACPHIRGLENESEWRLQEVADARQIHAFYDHPTMSKQMKRLELVCALGSIDNACPFFDRGGDEYLRAPEGHEASQLYFRYRPQGVLAFHEIEVDLGDAFVTGGCKLYELRRFFERLDDG